jgi:hypothetical protein
MESLDLLVQPAIWRKNSTAANVPNLCLDIILSDKEAATELFFWYRIWKPNMSRSNNETTRKAAEMQYKIHIKVREGENIVVLSRA